MFVLFLFLVLIGNYLLNDACIVVEFVVNYLSSYEDFPDCLIFVDLRIHMMVDLRLCRLRSGNSLNWNGRSKLVCLKD